MSKTWTKLTPLETVALEGYGGEQGIYVRPSFVRMFKGDGNAAIFMHHLLYWGRTDVAENADGWFYQTTQRIRKLTGLNIGVQERCRRDLIRMGILEQELRGMPARNYYRVNLGKLLEHLEGVNKPSPSDDTSSVDSTTQDQSDQLVIGYILEEEDKGIHSSLPPTSVETRTPAAVLPKNGKVSGSRKRAKQNVLGEKYHDFINWVVKTYPMNQVGLTATESEATRIANKLGDTYDDEKIPQAKADIQEFILGMKNFTQAVKSGTVNRMYIPGFGKFAGLGYMMKDDEPRYKKWAAQQAVPDTSRKIQV